MATLRLSPKGRRYGYISSKPKFDDNGFPSHIIIRTGDWPKRYFIKGPLGDVKDQGQQGSCCGHACSSLGERLYRFVHNMKPQFSPAYSYWMERKLEGTLSQGDCGAQITSALIVPDPRAPGGTGWCPLSVMPYNDAVCSVAPTQTQIDATKNYPGGAYHNIGNVIANMKSCMLSDYSFVIGVAVYDSFESDEAAASGLIPYPNVNVENCLGGHALHAGVGFDDDIQLPNSPNPGGILFENSWGTDWGCLIPQLGTRGGAWASYDFLMNPNLTDSVKMGHLGRPW